MTALSVLPVTDASDDRNAVIRIAGLGKRSPTKEGQLLEALRGVDLAITEGEFAAFSGLRCGKTTPLRILAGLDRHTLRRRGRGGQGVAQPGQPLTSVVFQETLHLPDERLEQVVAMPGCALQARARRSCANGSTTSCTRSA